jgi:hypothetical protein
MGVVELQVHGESGDMMVSPPPSSPADDGGCVRRRGEERRLSPSPSAAPAGAEGLSRGIGPPSREGPAPASRRRGSDGGSWSDEEDADDAGSEEEVGPLLPLSSCLLSLPSSSASRSLPGVSWFHIPGGDERFALSEQGRQKSRSTRAGSERRGKKELPLVLGPTGILTRSLARQGLPIRGTGRHWASFRSLTAAMWYISREE